MAVTLGEAHWVSTVGEDIVEEGSLEGSIAGEGIVEVGIAEVGIVGAGIAEEDTLEEGSPAGGNPEENPVGGSPEESPVRDSLVQGSLVRGSPVQGNLEGNPVQDSLVRDSLAQGSLVQGRLDECTVGVVVEAHPLVPWPPTQAKKANKISIHLLFFITHSLRWRSKTGRDWDFFREDFGGVGFIAKGNSPAAAVEKPHQTAVLASSPDVANHLFTRGASDDSTATRAKHAAQDAVAKACPKAIFGLSAVGLHAHLGHCVRGARTDAAKAGLITIITRRLFIK